MAAKKKASTTTRPRAPARRKTPRKAPSGSRGLEAKATLVEGDAPDLESLHAHVESNGGAVIGAYKDPFGGHALMIAVVPIDRVAPTPFQRDLSETHHKRLAEVIDKTGRFLDPIVTITAPKDSDVGFWTPNGLHRLEAMRRLGARSITTLLVPDRTVAWQILALNTEKAHNLKERALEVIRIYRGLLAEDDARTETSFSFYLEDPAFVTLGICYEKNGRFAGGAYHPVLRRVDKFHDAPLKQAIKEHEHAAELTLEVEAAVVAVVEKLRAKGLTSPYLRSFVVARINPLRWIQGELPPLDEVLGTMLERAKKFDVERVKQEDLVRAGGAPDEEAS